MQDPAVKQVNPGTTGAQADSHEFLTGRQWFAIVLAVFTIVLTALVNIGVREYYQPDVRYEEGTWYYSAGTAIISLRIKNYGATDAENIKFTARFAETVVDASVSDPTIDFHYDESGDPVSRPCTIERLVPGQTVTVYFRVDLPVVGRVMEDERFVHDMVYNGGQAKMGEPWFLRLTLAVVLSIPVGVGLSLMGLILSKQLAVRRYRRWMQSTTS